MHFKSILPFGIFLAFLTLPIQAALQPLPKVLQEIEAKYKKSPTLSAQFSQINTSAAFSKQKLSSGKIYFEHPSKIRWETLQPDPNLMVSDGKKVWFYTPPFDPTDPSEKGQLIEKPASAVQSKLAHALLSGSFSMAHLLTIKQINDITFQIVPLKGTADTVERATLVIDKDQKLITKIILEHQGGNRSEITLSQISLGKTLDENLFKFNPPPNTDKMHD